MSDRSSVQKAADEQRRRDALAQSEALKAASAINADIRKGLAERRSSTP